MNQVTDNKLMKKHKCPVCGKRFETNRKDAKTCSPKCRQALYRANPNPARPKPVAKKESGIKLGIVKTEQGLEFRYAQKIVKGEKADRFIKAINTLTKNTKLTINDIVSGRVNDPVDTIIELAEMKPDIQRRIIDLIAANGMIMKISLAKNEIEKEDREKHKKEFSIRSQSSQRR